MKSSKKKQVARSKEDVARGEFLRDFRERILAKDQKWLAKSLQVKQSAVSAWELGINRIPADKMLEIARLAPWPESEKMMAAAGVDLHLLRVLAGLGGADEVTIPFMEHEGPPSVSPAVLKTGKIILSKLLVPDPTTTLCVRLASHVGAWPFRNGDLVGVNSSEIPELGLKSFLDCLVAVQYSAIPMSLPLPHSERQIDMGPASISGSGHDREGLAERTNSAELMEKLDAALDRSGQWLKWAGIHVGQMRIELAPSNLWRLVVGSANAGQVALPLTDWQKPPFSLSNNRQIEKALENHAAACGLRIPNKILGKVAWWISAAGPGM